MERYRQDNALVFTCDPSSNVVDPNDKGTALIFGDAASVTHVRRRGDGYSIVDARFGTEPATASCPHTHQGALQMEGIDVSTPIADIKVDVPLVSQGLDSLDMATLMLALESK